MVYITPSLHIIQTQDEDVILTSNLKEGIDTDIDDF